MHEAHVVKRLHGPAELDGPAQPGGHLEGSLGQDLGQAAPLDELHGHEGVAVLSIPKLQHADQGRMGRRGRDNRFAYTRHRLRGLGRAHEPAGQEPDRDFVTGRLVLGQGHVPEGADPQVADDPIATLWHRRRPRQALRGVSDHGASGLERGWGWDGTEPKAGDKATREGIKHRRIARTLASRAERDSNGPTTGSRQPPTPFVNVGQWATYMRLTG